jgi:hypothetical protein
LVLRKEESSGKIAGVPLSVNREAVQTHSKEMEKPTNVEWKAQQSSHHCPGQKVDLGPYQPAGQKERKRNHQESQPICQTLGTLWLSDAAAEHGEISKSRTQTQLPAAFLKTSQKGNFKKGWK